MLTIKNLSKTYVSKKGASCKALNEINLTLPSKGCVFILGKSGSGKSTLLNIIGGLDSPSSGEMSYNGKSFSDFKDKDYDDYRNNVVGFVFQEYNLIDKFNVFQNIDIATKMQGGQDTTEKIKEALNIVGLSGYEKRMVSELSGGQKQRVAIARALVKDSKIILADEPTGNLDSETSKEIFDLLKEISKNKLVVIVSHDEENAKKYADRIIELKDGSIINDSEINAENQANDIAESDNINYRTSKLSFKYMLKMATHNLLFKKVRSVVAVLVVSLAVMLVCFSQVIYSYDAEKAIAKSAINLNNEYLSMERLIGINENNIRLYSGINQGSCKFLDKENIYYVKVYNYRQYVIHSPQDIIDLGFSLYDGYLEIDNDGKYYTDYSIQELLTKGTVDYEGEFSYEKIVGKCIKEKVSTIGGSVDIYHDKILGVIKTNYEKFTDKNLKILEELPKDYINDQEYIKEYNNFVQNCKNEFISYDKLMQNRLIVTVSNNFNRGHDDFRKKTKENYIFKFSSGEKTADLVENNTITVSENDYILALTNDGYKDFGVESYAKDLNQDEIILSLDLYNALFGDEIEPLTEKNMPENYVPSDKSTYYMADYVPKHLGEKIDFTLIQKDLGENYLELNNKKLVGVAISKTWSEQYLRGERDYNAYVATGEINNNVLKNYYSDAVNTGLMVKMTNYEDSLHMLKTMKNDYNMYVNGGNNFGGIFYEQEVTKETSNVIFLVTGIISVIITLLIIINLISFSITSRTREIGILRGLGAHGKDVVKIFILESLIIGLLVFFLSFVGIFTSIHFVNKSFARSNKLLGSVFFIANSLTCVLMLGISIVVILLASYIPLIKLNKMKPVDCIKN